MTLENDEDKLLLEREVANKLNISIVTLRKLRSEGKGPKFGRIGGSIRYQLSDVKKFIEKKFIEEEKNEPV